MKTTFSTIVSLAFAKSLNSQISRSVTFVPLLLCLAGAPTIFAATKTWDGSSSGNWATGANWSGGTTPAAGDDLVFPLGVTRLDITNNFSPNRGFNSVTFLGTNYTLRGSTLMVTNGIRSGTPGGDNVNRIPNTIFADVLLGGAQTFVPSNIFTKLVFHGDIAMGSHTLTIDGDGDSDFFGIISGTGGFIKDGFGICNLETNNTFTGTVTILDGRIRAEEPFSLGTTNGSTIVRQGALLEIQTSVTNETLTLSGGGWFINTQPGRWRGPVNVVSNSTVDAAGDLILDGVLSGSAQLSIDTFISGLDAEMTLTGATDNTLTGTIRLEEGRLILNKPASVDAVAGPLIVGDGTGSVTNATVRFAANDQILAGGSSGVVTVLNDGTLDLAGHSDVLHDLILVGGLVTNTGSGSLQLAGDGRVQATSVGSTPARIRSQFNLGTANRSFFVTNGPATSDLEIDGRVFGAVNLNKDEAGVMSLLASNSFTGIAHILAGTLQVDDDFAFGTLGGDRVVVHDGATLRLLTGADNIAQNLALNGDGDGGNGALRSLGTVSWNGDVTLASDSLINVESGTLTLAGVMDGSGGFAKIGAGTLRLAGASANTYAGNTELRAGVLELAKSSGFAISNSASLLIGDASDGESTDTVRYADDNQLRTTVNIFIHRTGLLNLNGFTDDVGDIDLTGGDIQTGVGTLQLRGNLTAIGDLTPGSPFSTFDPCTISGNLDLGTSTRTFTVNDHGFLSGVPVDLIVDALISGTGAITKAGAGELQLGGTNTYSGTTTINAGRIVVVNNSALGTSLGGTVANSPGIVELRDDTSVASEPLTLNNSSTNPAVLFSSSGTNAWNGPISLTRTAAVNVATSSSLNLGGIISGVGGLTKIGNGILSFLGGGNNTYAGTTLVLDGLARVSRDLNEAGIFEVIPGRLIVGDDASAPSNAIVRFEGCCAIDGSAQVAILASGLIDVNGTGNAFGSLTGTGPLQLGTSAHGSSAAGLSVGANNLTTTFDGLISGSIGSLTKIGTGTLTLTANNSYSAPTIIQAGALEVNGSQGNSDITVRTNASLQGRGSVGDLNVALNGNVNPGTSPGKLTAQNTVFSNDAVLNIEIHGPVVGTDYDQLNVNGTVNLTGSKLFLSGDLSNAPPFEGDVFTILNNNGTDAVVGTFDGRVSGSVTTLGGIPLRLDYNGGTGNDVTLTVAGLPLRGTNANVTLGNGDGRVDPNECNNLFLRLTNVSASTLTSIQGTLTTTTPGVIITDRQSPYPNIGPGFNSVNSIPFQFFTTPAFQCGSSIEFDLLITAANQSPFNLRVVLQSGALAPTQTFNNNTPLTLPGSGTVSSPLTVSGVSGGIAKATVSMVLQHPNLGELVIQLIAPDGTGVTLTGPLSGNQLGTNCTSARTTFDDDAAQPIGNGSSPFIGSFRPLTPLASLDGRSGAQINGTWQLRVFDLVGNAQPGVLSCWSLNLTPANCALGGGPCTPCNGPFFGSITTNDAVRIVPVPPAAPTTCTSAPCALLVFPDPVPTDSYVFTNGSADACVTVTLDAPCASSTNVLLSTATGPGGAPDCGNIIGQSAHITGSPASYSFRVPANGVFVVNVHGGEGGSGLCANYTLRVDGFDCAVPLTIGKVAPGAVSLCWPTHGSDLQLECSTTLVPPSWVVVTNPPVAVNGFLCVTNAGTNSTQFYRLHKP